MLKKSATLSIIAILLFSCVIAFFIGQNYVTRADSNTYVVSGYVTSPDGMGVINASVEAMSSIYMAQAYSDATGFFQINVPAENYLMRVYAPANTNLLNYESSLTVSGNMVWNLTLETGCVVSGYLSAPNGTQVSNVQVWVNDFSATPGTSNASGYYSITVPSGNNTLVFYPPPNCNLLHSTQSIFIDNDASMNFTLLTGPVIYGYLLQPSGRSVENGGLSFTGNSYYGYASTDSSGYYSVALQAGTYLVNTNPPIGSDLLGIRATINVFNDTARNWTLPSSLIPATSWSMFRGNPAHSGYSSSIAARTNYTIWNTLIGGDGSSAIGSTVANGVVYSCTSNGNVYALNATTGNTLWSSIIGGNAATSPAVGVGLVFASIGGNIYALNITTGAQVWHQSGGGNAPMVNNGLVYEITSDNGTLIAFNATSGSIIWSYPVGNTVQSPAIQAGILYVGSATGNLYALNAQSGSLQWTLNYGGGSSSPATAGGLVCLGADNGNVYGVSTQTGQLLWEWHTNSSARSSAAIANGLVYIGSNDTNVYALNATTGASQWNFPTRGIVFSSPAVADGFVYVGSYDGTLYALNSTTGSSIWSYDTGVYVYSSPTIANGTVYIGSSDGYLYAFKTVPLISPTVSVSSNTINQGSTATLSSKLNTGTPPYTYQWFAKSPTSQIYSMISGANSATYNFITSTSTATGTWAFIIQVSDSIGSATNSSETSIIVNQLAVNPTPTTTQKTNAVTPSPKPTASPVPTPAPSPNATSTPTPQPTNTTESFIDNKPLVRNLEVTDSVLNIPTNPISPQVISTMASAAAALGAISIATLAVTRLSSYSPLQISGLSLPRQLQSLLKKIAEKRLESLFKRKKLNARKQSLVTKREILALSATIIFNSFVIGFVTINGLPDALNAPLYLRFVAAALLSVLVTQTLSFFLDVYFSNRSKTQKELKLWSVGTISYFATGLLLKFPFSSPAKTDTYGSFRYKSYQERKISALIGIAKAFALALAVIPFAILSTSSYPDLVVAGSAGLLATLISFCFALMPLGPSSGRDLFLFKKPLALLLLIPTALLILHYVGWLTFWGYIVIGLLAAVTVPIVIWRLEKEKKIILQTDANLWFK